jgi:hypothetical protein
MRPESYRLINDRGQLCVPQLKQLVFLKPSPFHFATRLLLGDGICDVGEQSDGDQDREVRPHGGTNGIMPVDERSATAGNGSTTGFAPLCPCLLASSAAPRGPSLLASKQGHEAQTATPAVPGLRCAQPRPHG